MPDRNMIRNIKRRVLPPSSRSFHDTSDDLIKRLDDLSRQLSEIGSGLAHVTGEINLVKEQSRLRFEALYKRDGESNSDARRRFFLDIPDATGDFRLHQLANAKLMKELDDICRKENLTYWFSYGTLIAALSRHGFIPWDDDIDICMMREDIDKLKQVLSDSDTYQLTLVYDWFSPCRQIRFSLKDRNVPCFIDVSIYDWASEASQDNDDVLRKMRLDLMHSIHQPTEFPYWKQRGWLFAKNSGFVVQSGDVDPASQDSEKATSEIARIEQLFTSYSEQAHELGVLCDKEGASSIAYAIDNTYDAPWRRIIWPKDMFFPVKVCNFEDYSFYIPSKSEDVADECYPGWPYLPNDMLSHRHIGGSLFTDAAIKAAISEYLSS